jgi:guanylate kinase
MNAPGRLVIVSGPSGSGKSTVIDRALAAGDLPARLSVSATTRSPRPGERDGVHYHFWTPERFAAERARGAFLEWAEVHGHCYGTLRSEVEPYRRQGLIVVLDIDVQGARQVRGHCPDAAAVFVRASSLGEYERRLRRRATEDEAALRRRVAAARAELAHADEYDFQVVNDDLDAAVARFRAVLEEVLKRETHAG